MAELSNEDVNRIAEALLEKATEDVGVRDIMIGSVMGKGAIPLYGRETRQEPCACCLIDPEGPNAPENRMCTTKGAIGTLNDREEREWCSEINIVPDGRCARARAISEAARVCKEKYPEDTAKFFECFTPAFSKITKGSNPGTPDQEEGERIAQQLGNGVIYTGPQMYHEELYAHLFTDAAVTGTTFACLGLEECKAKLIQKRKDFGATPPTFRGNPTEYVTIADPGKTTFKMGELVSREAFEKENERVKKLGEKPATGRD